MSGHVHDELLATALGVAPAGTRNQVEVHLLSCAPCNGAHARARDAAALLAAALPPRPTSAPMREQLLHAAGEVDRFTDLVGPLSRMLALPRRTIERLFAQIDAGAPWVYDPRNGTARWPIPDREDVALVRLGAGQIVGGAALGCAATVLQGRCQGLDGAVYTVGTTIRAAPGSRPRGVLALPGPDVICVITAVPRGAVAGRRRRA